MYAARSVHPHLQNERKTAAVFEGTHVRHSEKGSSSKFESNVVFNNIAGKIFGRPIASGLRYSWLRSMGEVKVKEIAP